MEGELDVAVKVFDQPEGRLSNTAADITRSYADMRYELNKLSTLSHPYIVRFIGVLTNPHCFVLEWAPLKSLEHVRSEHHHCQSYICARSIFEVLLQVIQIGYLLLVIFSNGVYHCLEFVVGYGYDAVFCAII